MWALFKEVGIGICVFGLEVDVSKQAGERVDQELWDLCRRTDLAKGFACPLEELPILVNVFWGLLPVKEEHGLGTN